MKTVVLLLCLPLVLSSPDSPDSPGTSGALSQKHQDYTRTQQEKLHHKDLDHYTGNVVVDVGPRPENPSTGEDGTTQKFRVRVSGSQRKENSDGKTTVDGHRAIQASDGTSEDFQNSDQNPWDRSDPDNHTGGSKDGQLLDGAKVTQEAETEQRLVENYQILIGIFTDAQLFNERTQMEKSKEMDVDEAAQNSKLGVTEYGKFIQKSAKLLPTFEDIKAADKMQGFGKVEGKAKKFDREKHWENSQTKVNRSEILGKNWSKESIENDKRLFKEPQTEHAASNSSTDVTDVDISKVTVHEMNRHLVGVRNTGKNLELKNQETNNKSDEEIKGEEINLDRDLKILQETPDPSEDGFENTTKAKQNPFISVDFRDDARNKHKIAADRKDRKKEENTGQKFNNSRAKMAEKDRSNVERNQKSVSFTAIKPRAGDDGVNTETIGHKMEDSVDNVMNVGQNIGNYRPKMVDLDQTRTEFYQNNDDFTEIRLEMADDGNKMDTFQIKTTTVGPKSHGFTAIGHKIGVKMVDISHKMADVDQTMSGSIMDDQDSLNSEFLAKSESFTATKHKMADLDQISNGFMEVRLEISDGETNMLKVAQEMEAIGVKSTTIGPKLADVDRTRADMDSKSDRFKVIRHKIGPKMADMDRLTHVQRQDQDQRARPARDLEECQDGVRVLDDLRSEVGPEPRDRFSVDRGHSLDLLEDLQGLHTEDQGILDLDSKTGQGLEPGFELDESKDQTGTEDLGQDREASRFSDQTFDLDMGLAPPSSWTGLWDELRSLRRLVLVLKGRDSDRSQTIRTLETTLRDLTQETQQSQTRSRTVDQDLRETRKNVQELQHQNQDLKFEFLELKSRLNQTQSLPEDLQRSQESMSELLFLQTRLRAAEGAVEELKRKGSVFASKLCAAESQLQRLSLECNTSSSSEAERLDLLSLQKQGTVFELKGALNSTQTLVQELGHRVTDLRAEMVSMTTSGTGAVEELRSHMEQLQKHLQKNSSAEVSEVKEKLQQELDLRLSGTVSELNSTQTLVQELGHRVTDLRAEMVSMMTSGTGAVEELRSHMEQLQKQSSAEVSEVKEKLEQELDLKLSGAVEELRSHMEQLQKHLEHLQRNSSDDVSEVKKKLRQELDLSLSGTVSELKGALNSTQNLVQELGHRVTDLRAEMVSMTTSGTAEVSEVKQELDLKLSAAAERIHSVSEKLRDVQAQTEDDTAALKLELSSLLSRVSVFSGQMQKNVEQLQTDCRVLSVRLDSLESHLGQLHTQNKAQSDQAQSVEKHLEQLQRENKAAAQQLQSVSENILQTQTQTLELQTSFRAGDEELRTKTEAQLWDVLSRLDTAEKLSAAVSSKLEETEDALSHIKDRADDVDQSLRLIQDQLHSLSTDVRQRWNSTEDALQLLSLSAKGLGLRLDHGLGLVQDLVRETSVLELRMNQTRARVQDGLTDVTERLEQLHTHSTVLYQRLNSTEDRLSELSSTGVQKVAFSVGLTDSGAVGPFDSETVLKFSKVLINEGSAYDPSTGLVQAPVPGVYFFSFCVSDFLKGYMGVSLCHNDRPITFSLSLNAHGGYSSVCNSALLWLKAGDTVSLRLPASYRLYDDQRDFSLFTGFML